MDQRRISGDGPEPTRRRLRVRRIQPGESWMAWMLSPAIGGLLYHHVRKRSHYCPPEGGCEATLHRTPKFWHGYVAALFWNEAGAAWEPDVLEVSEACELDMRGLYRRGQVWRLWRNTVARKAEPIRAELHEDRPGAETPSAFDVRPVLAVLYHFPEIDLSTPNPLPARQYSQVVEGQAPIAPPVEPATQPARAGEIREMLEQRRKRLNAVAQTNGHAKKEG